MYGLYWRRSSSLNCFWLSSRSWMSFAGTRAWCGETRLYGYWSFFLSGPLVQSATSSQVARRHNIMAVSEEAAIRCAGLSKTYGSFEALKGLDLTIPRHSIFGLLGPNGAGKSTTIKLLTRQIAPTSGPAWVDGAPITGQTVDVRSRIGYLSEQPAFYGWMRGSEFLDFVGELFGLKSSLY